MEGADLLNTIRDNGGTQIAGLDGIQRLLLQ